MKQKLSEQIKTTFKKTKETFWKDLLVTTIYYFLLLITISVSIYKILIWIIDLKPLLDQFVNIAKPTFEATGTLDPALTSRVLLLGDQLKTTSTKIIVITIFIIVIFALIRSCKDKIILEKTCSKKKKPKNKLLFWKLSISIFLSTLTNILLVILINYIFDSAILIALSPLILLTLHKLSILSIESYWLNKKISFKGIIKIFSRQIISFMLLAIIFFITGLLLNLIYSKLFYGLILITYIILVFRENFLLKSLLEKSNEQAKPKARKKTTKQKIKDEKAE